MQNVRIRFEKTGRMIYCSHLDLMRCMSRAMNRAGVSVYYTEGFNPHPYIVFGPPLSLGYASLCEVMDFRVTDDSTPRAVLEALSPQMPQGLTLLTAYTPENPLKHIAWAGYEISLTLSAPSRDAAGEISLLFSLPALEVEKRTKKMTRTLDIIPLIRSLSVTGEESGVRLEAVLACGNTENLNPEYLVGAVRDRLPGLGIEGAAFVRREFYNEGLEIFR